MSKRPPCPNHGCEMDPTNERHIWICPVSGARFEVEVDYEEKEKHIKKDKFGNIKHDWKIKQVDGGTGG